MRYADPDLCPDCRHRLPSSVTTCPTCGLLVRHRLAVDLFGALRRADDLVVQLRALSGAAALESAPALRRAASAGGTMTVDPPTPRVATTYPPPAAPPADHLAGGTPTSSVPTILLGLGAFCLLVASVAFLAVSWSWLGVAGRTVVLVGLTAGAGGAALWLNRTGLRIAAESLMVLALGVLALDVLGASASGLVDLDGGALTALTGLVLAGGAGAAAAPQPRPGAQLGGPQVVLPLGVLLAYVGLAVETGHGLVVGHLAVAVLAASTVASRRAGWSLLPWAAAVTGALLWLVTAFAGLVVALDRPGLGAVWLDDGSGWSLLVSAAALAGPGVVLRSERLLVAGLAGTALVATTALTIPTLAVDRGSDLGLVPNLVAVLVTAAWAAVAGRLPRSSRAVAITPAAAGSVILGLFLLVTCGNAAVRVLGAGAPLDRSASVTVTVDTGVEVVTEPLLAVPSVLAVLLLLAVVVGRRRGVLEGGAVASGLAAVGTLASYDVPLGAVVVALGALSLGALLAALTRHEHATAQALLAATAVGLGVAATLSGLASAPLACAGAAVWALASGTIALRGRAAGRTIGALSVAPALGTLVWCLGAATDVEVSWRGPAVLVVVGAAALAAPSSWSPVCRLAPAVEVPAAVVGLVAAVVSVVHAAVDGAGSSALAVHLTVAGVLVTGTSLLHPGRRACAVPGGALLVLATWVRLADLGVTAPEPYTLPSALALLAVGLVHLKRNPASATVTALTPGLVLGLVPSLLWVHGDPASLRAVLLGVACLATTLVGAALRWTAPLVTGAAVGAVLVLREVGPYAADVPQWIWLGLAGALLLVVGITWERRLLEVRRATGFLGRLR